MDHPLELIHPTISSHVWKLNNALYSLQQAHCVWFDKFGNFFISYGLSSNTVDLSLFIYKSFHGNLILLLCIDNVLLTSSNFAHLNSFINVLGQQFVMKDFGSNLHYLLGIQVIHTPNDVILSQVKYTLDILDGAQMQYCKPKGAPTMPKIKGLTSDALLWSCSLP